jgi:Uncharacterized membrane protein, required for colicin V production
MNWLDIVILCLLGAGLIKGLYDGVIKQVVAIGALIIGIYLCTGVAHWLFGYLTQLEWFPQQAAKLTSYILGFLLIVGVILLAGNIIHKLVSVTPLSILNHLAGGFLGLLLMVLFISFLLNIIEMFDTGSSLLSQELKVESNFYYKIKNIIPNIFPGDLFNLKIDAIE